MTREQELAHSEFDLHEIEERIYLALTAINVAQLAILPIDYRTAQRHSATRFLKSALKLLEPEQ